MTRSLAAPHMEATRFVFISALVLALVSPRLAWSADSKPYRMQVIVRSAEQFRNHRDVMAFVAKAAAHGVAVISVAAKQDEDDELPSGDVFYRSGIASVAAGYEDFDVLADVIREAHRRGIRVYAWVPQFHDQAAAKRHPDWQMQAMENGRIVPFVGKKKKEYFLNPLNRDAQRYELSIIEEIVTRYPVDGIALDWIRFDDYNMDLSPTTRRAYLGAVGRDPAQIDFTRAGAEVAAWNAWRSEKLAAYVKTVRASIHRIKPHVALGVYVLPPEFKEVGQDLALFAPYVDFVSPMAYFADWGYDPEWVYRDLMPMTNAKAGGKPIVPALDIWWNNDQYCDIISNLRHRERNVTELAWFKYGKWTERDLARTDRWRQVNACKP